MGHCKWEQRDRIETGAAWRGVDGITKVCYRQAPETGTVILVFVRGTESYLLHTVTAESKAAA